YKETRQYVSDIFHGAGRSVSGALRALSIGERTRHPKPNYQPTNSKPDQGDTTPRKTGKRAERRQLHEIIFAGLRRKSEADVMTAFVEIGSTDGGIPLKAINVDWRAPAASEPQAPKAERRQLHQMLFSRASKKDEREASKEEKATKAERRSSQHSPSASQKKSASNGAKPKKRQLHQMIFAWLTKSREGEPMES
ncbi:MAG: hypothetical protein AAGF25_14060, partial [Pseudomonadota bacterium]